MKQQTFASPLEAQPNGLEAILRNLCLGLTGTALQASLAAHQQLPPEPPTHACPVGAVEAMPGTLGLWPGTILGCDWYAGYLQEV